MIVIIGFVLERQPCLSEWQDAESFPVTPNDSDQEYALNITPKLYWPDSTTLQYNSIDTALAQKTCTKLAAFQINIEKIHCVAWIAFRTSSAPAEIPIWKTEFGWTGSFGCQTMRLSTLALLTSSLEPSSSREWRLRFWSESDWSSYWIRTHSAKLPCVAGGRVYV